MQRINKIRPIEVKCPHKVVDSTCSEISSNDVRYDFVINPGKLPGLCTCASGQTKIENQNNHVINSSGREKALLPQSCAHAKDKIAWAVGSSEKLRQF